LIPLAEHHRLLEAVLELMKQYPELG